MKLVRSVSPFHLKKLKWTAWAIGNSTNTTYSANAGSRNSATAANRLGPRRRPGAVPTVVVTTAKIPNGPAFGRPVRGERSRPGYWVLAAFVMSVATFSGVPVPANRVATAALMEPPRADVVAWSR